MPRRNHSHTKAQGHKSKPKQITPANAGVVHPENSVRKSLVVRTRIDSETIAKRKEFGLLSGK